jgi:predicted phosphodiesterase
LRIAIIADIHGNRVALDAVLTPLSREQIDQIICLGDVPAMGPEPHEVVHRLRTLDCPVIMGNTDEWLLHGLPFAETDERTRRIAELFRWGREQLSREDQDYLRSFRRLLDIPLGDSFTLLCFHGSPRSNMDLIFSTTPDEELKSLLAGYNATVMAGGHTHIQMLRRYNNSTIINVGSIGLPGGPLFSGVHRPPWAEYALIDVSNRVLDIEFRRVPLDIEALVEATVSSGMPYAETWIQEWTPVE